MSSLRSNLSGNLRIAAIFCIVGVLAASSLALAAGDQPKGRWQLFGSTTLTSDHRS